MPEATMRRGMMIALVLVLAAGVMPPAAQARPRGLGAVLGVITNPIGAILGAAHHAGRRAAPHRRSSVARSRRAAPAAAAAGVAAGAATAATSRATTEAAAPATTAAVGTEPTSSQVEPADTAADAKIVPKTVPATVQAAAPVPPAQGSTPSAAPEPAALVSSRPERNARRLGMTGPAVWPAAFEDVIGYALWPADFAERLRSHGVGDVLAAALTPASALVARAGLDTSGAKSTTGSGGTSSICGSAEAPQADWPARDIARELSLDDTQRSALDQLQGAIGNAGASIRKTCRDASAPVDRLRAMQNTLWAVHDAAQAIRDPLAKFNNSLTDDQKKKLATPAAAQSDAGAASRGEAVKICGRAGRPEMISRQLDALHAVKPQRDSLEALQKKSFEMGQFLMASCLKPVPATPAERLDAATDRLTAMIFAASNINMALNDLSSRLSDEQKAKLGSLGH
jgi:hypothetical protein